MNTSHAIFVLLLCIGTINALESFTFGFREAGDRPIYIQTLETNETNPEIGELYVYYQWVGVNQTFTQVYVETNNYSWATLSQPGNIYPLYERTFELEVASLDPNHLIVSFIVFGFVNQPPTHPGTVWPIMDHVAESKLIERITYVAV